MSQCNKPKKDFGYRNIIYVWGKRPLPQNIISKMLQSEYDKILSFASYYFKSKPHIDHNDVVNDVVLEILSSGKNVGLEDAISKIKKHHSLFAPTVETQGHDFSKSDTQRVCRDCKELLPVGAFYILKQKTKLAIASYCKDCQKKRSLKYYHKEENNAKAKSRQNDYYKNVVRKNKENVSDSYIIKRLCDNASKRIKKGQVTRDEVKNAITKKAIAEHRAKMIEKRNKNPKRLNPLLFKDYNIIQKAISQIAAA
jgi:hypothetical protein